MENNTVKKTALYENHIEYNAKMIDFSGYLMPINYPDGIKNEYNAVRNNVGMFDVSHMGVFKVSGKKSMEFLNNILSNDITALKDGRAMYSLLCNNNGGIIDDLIIYKMDDYYLMIVNASNKNKNLLWMKSHAEDGVMVSDISPDYSLIAIQGPNSRDKISEIFNIELSDLSFYGCIKINYLNEEIFIARTGYTGELGYELLGNHKAINSMWKSMLSKSVKPIGLAVRDILRIEMGYCLYGHEISENQNPIEAGLGWIIDRKSQFIGSDKVLNTNNHNQKLVFIKVLERGIPRQGCEIFSDSKKIGHITSGTFSYKLNCGIGIGYINSSLDSALIPEVIIRNKSIPIEISTNCFLKGTSLKK